MADQVPSQKVLVIGAGIVGLLIAQGLKKEGIPCTVYEYEPSASHYRPREWGMSMQWGLPLLKHCFTPERYNQINTAAVDPYYEPEDPGRMPTFNGATGEHMKDIPLLRMYRVSRRRFRTFCVEGIDVQYGKSLKEIIYYADGKTVTANFEDGTSASGTLLIGADGTHSKTRHLIFNNDPAADALPVPYNAINPHVCYNDAPKAKHVRSNHPIMYHAIHPSGYWLFVAVQDVPDPSDPSTWTFQLQTTWKKGTKCDPCTSPSANGDDEAVDSLEKHYARAETMGEPFQSANLWIPEGTKLSINKMAYWVPIPWDSRGGRVIVAGDAAHPMTCQRGQGLNHGIADAANLTQLLAQVKAGRKSSQEAAVHEYIDELVPRAGEEVKGSIVNTNMLHDWEKVQQSGLLTRGGYANAGNKVALEEQRHK